MIDMWGRSLSRPCVALALASITLCVLFLWARCDNTAVSSDLQYFRSGLCKYVVSLKATSHTLSSFSGIVAAPKTKPLRRNDIYMPANQSNSHRYALELADGCLGNELDIRGHYVIRHSDMC